MISCPFYFPMFLHHLSLPKKIERKEKNKERKKDKNRTKNSRVFFLLSSWEMACNHFIFFLGCLTSPVQTRTETSDFRVSLTGVLLQVDIHPHLGQWKVENTFPKAGRCTLRPAECHHHYRKGRKPLCGLPLVLGSRWPVCWWCRWSSCGSACLM